MNRLGFLGPRRWVAMAALGLGLAAPAAAMDIREVVSPGGIRAWLVEEHALPIVTLAFAFNGGSAQDPKGRAGTAIVTGSLLTEGAGPYAGTAFAERLADLSAQMLFDLNLDELTGTLRTTSEDRDAAFELLRAALNEPYFEAEARERMRNEIVGYVRALDASPDSVAGHALWAAAYPDHPYGLPYYGTVDGLAAVTDADIRAYHRNVITRGGLTVAVVGDIDAATLGVKLDEVFGSLPETGTLTPVPAVEPALDTPRIDLPFPDIAATVVLAAGGGLTRDDPGFAAPGIATHIFGGTSFSSRMFRELRFRGLVYTPSSVPSQMARSGMEVLSASTRADRAAETISRLQEMVATYAAEGPTDEEIEAARKFLIGNFAMQFDGSLATAMRLVGMQLEGLGRDYPDRRAAMFRAVTPDEVRAAARKIYGGGLLMVTVGLPP